MKLCEACHNGFYGSPDHCPSCGVDLSRDAEVTGHELVGMVVGEKYRLAEVLGEGAMGWVYRAVHQALERSVAVKLLKTAGEAQPEQVKRFEQEARAISRLHHPHIVSVIDFGRTVGGIFYLVTEYVEGGSLADLLAQEDELSLVRIVGIFHQILAAVEEAHSAYVIHRDLKPENIAITPLRSGEDFVKVLDFGIAMMSDENRPRMTAQGSTVGTPGFMSPETIMEGASDARSDIYALANILFEMLVGRPPFEHDWPMALLSLHLNETPPTLREAAPEAGFSEELEQVVSKGMAKEPDERFESIAEFRAELLAAINRIDPVELQCQRCNRPRNPSTGLCGLHGHHSSTESSSPPLSSGPPVSSPSAAASAPPVDVTSSTLIEQASLNRSALVDRVRGDDAVGHQDETQALVDYLLGDSPLLEIAGAPGGGKSRMLRGLGRAAETVGLRVLSMQPDPRWAQRPWYPVRSLVGQLLGCEPEPESVETLTAQAVGRGLADEHQLGLSLLFGFAHQEASGRWFERAKMVRRAAAAVIAATADDSPGTCVIAEDVLDYDRASQGFVLSLPRRLRGGHAKLAISSDGAFWPTRKDRAVIRPRALEATDVSLLLARAGFGDHADKATLARRIATVAAGNPYHARQAVIAFSEGRELSGSLLDLLSWRLERLPADATRLLRAICALGWDVDLAELGPIIDEDIKLLATDMLVRAELLISGPNRSLSAAHATLARTVLETMPRAERAALHGAIVAHLESQDASVFLRAHHAYEGAANERALELLIQAGDEACRWSDVETAALVHYRKATHVARWRLLWSQEDPRYLELSLKMGGALRASGHARAAEVVFKEILGSAERHPTISDRARRGLSTLQSA